MKQKIRRWLETEAKRLKKIFEEEEEEVKSHNEKYLLNKMQAIEQTHNPLDLTILREFDRQ